MTPTTHPTAPRHIPTSHDRTRLAAHAAVSIEVVRRAYLGAPIRSTTAARIIAAARDLGLPVPAVVIAP
jgi:hypothetical protein